MKQNNSDKKKKVIFANAHWSNRGDEAALRALIDGIKADKPDWDIEVMIKDSESAKQFPYDDVSWFLSKFLPKNIVEFYLAIWTGGVICRNKSMSDTIKRLKTADLIVYAPGGAVFSDKFWWIKQLEKMVPFACAKKWNIPMVVAAPSIGPFDKETRKYRINTKKKYLSVPKKLIVREPLSKGYLESIGINNVELTIDSAFLDDVSTHSEQCHLIDNDQKLSDFLNKFDKCVGLTVIESLWHIEAFKKDKELPEKIRNSIKQFIDYLKSNNVGVVLIPQLFGNQNDIDMLKSYENDNTYILPDIYDTYSQQYVISKLDMMIGMRYHTNIFAAKAAVPFIAIAYEEKMSGFLKDWDLEDLKVDISEIKAEILIDKYIELKDRDAECIKTLQTRREIWRDLAAKTLFSIEEFME